MGRVYPMVKIFLAASVLSLVTVTFLSASSSAASGQKTKAEPTRELYVANCQSCHGEDGRAPTKEMGFVGRQWKTKTAAAAAKVITNGVPGTAMLPFEGKLTKQQINALARYVRALDTPAARKKQ
jgi:mono/diheme cytochrome c family protein